MARPSAGEGEAGSDGPESASRPLAGVRVVDLTQVVSGAVTSMLLADFGAEVIKVEPLAGESYRNSGYPISSDAGETNLNILRFSRGKKSVAIDLKTPEGRGLLLDLVRRADVLVENFRPGVAARLGIDKEQLKAENEGLIYASVSGYGHDDLFESPFQDRPAYAIITEAMAGLMHLAGDGEGPPVWMGFAMSDIFAGALAFSGVLMAMIDAGNGRRGRRVDIAMHDGALFMNDLALAAQSVVGETMGGGRYTLQSPWGPFETSDGYVTIAVLTEAQWKSLARVIGRPDLADDERLDSGQKRSRMHEELVAGPIADWARERTKEQCADELLVAGVPAAPVRTPPEVVGCEAVAAREMMVEISDNVIGKARVVGNPIKLDGHPDGAATHVPTLGEHTRAVLGDLLGLEEAKVRDLIDRGVVGA